LKGRSAPAAILSYYRAGTDRAGKPALDLGEFHSRALESRAVASDLMIQAVFMEENARSALKRVPWGKLTAVFAVAIVVAWVLGYLAGVFVRSGFGGLW